ncbi:hypothetical protein PV04_07360 [Phialophora macrospora]|uniref:RRM domain-containing protein n=1 Tax=Phialophora macrospora TaxID=1851006 RepID=A0A0D2CIN9_9EURO|nr:hypothetical protein PV04_07360 [Phialophora macrospora]
MTRNLGGQQSLKAEVFEVGNGTQMGHCTIKGRADAVKVYENLCTRGWNGQRVRVQLSTREKNGALRTVEGPKESNGSVDSAAPPSLSRPDSRGSIATPHPATPGYTAAAQPSAPLVYNPQYPKVSGWSSQQGAPPPIAVRAPITPYAPGICAGQHVYLPSTAHAPTMNPAAQYGAHFPTKAGPVPVSPTSSLPLRPINDGTTVFLSGLPFYQSESELRSLLKRYGNVLYLEIHPDRRNPGKNKGTARARYKTLSEALSAVRGLDGQLLRDRKISVKQERDDAPGPAGPRRSLHAAKDSVGSTAPKPKPNVEFSSAASGARSKKSRDASRGPSRANERSQRSTSSTGLGPLVVNGASAQRGVQGASSSRDSDPSSDDDSDGDEDSEASSDADDDEGVQEVTRKMHHHRL